MKNKAFVRRGLVALFASFVSMVSFASCPSPGSITISNDFKVTPPDSSWNVSIGEKPKSTGPIRLKVGSDSLTQLLANDVPDFRHPPFTFDVYKITCQYWVGSSSGNFILWKNASFKFTVNHVDGSDGWLWDNSPRGLQCMKLPCDF